MTVKWYGDKWLAKFDKRLDRALQTVGERLKGDINKHWSRRVPSSPGKPPAIRTGALRASATLERKNSKLYHFYFTSRYAVHLEFGAPRSHMAARPFIRPGVARIAPQVADIVKKAMG